MKKRLAVVFLSAAFAMTAQAAQAADKGPNIQIVDGKVTITAEAVPLARLLTLLDRATGMTSKVPPDLANRNVSVRVSGLNLEDAIDKIFEGQPLNYIMIQGQSIVVTGLAQTITANRGPAPYSPPQPQDNVFVNDLPPFPNPQQPNQAMNGQGQPAMVQTPFGMMVNPNVQQQQQQNNNSPMSAPGQQNNTIFGSSNSTPFGSTPVNTLGNPNNNPFGQQQNGGGASPSSPGASSPFPSSPGFPTSPPKKP